MRSHSTRRLGAALVLAVVALALLAAGCGGSSSSGDEGVASIEDDSATPAAETSGETTGSEATDPQQAMLDYAQCMRDNGIDFPDPDFSGGGGLFQIGGEGSDIDPSDPDFQAADEKCQPILEDSRPQLSEEDQQAMQDAFLEYAQCMRDNGIDFPDPDFSEGGGVGVRIGPNSDIDPDDPDFQAADKECQPILEESGVGPPRSGGPDQQTEGGGDGS
jgi:hypothetical protein